jgi:outer membrane protein TolC
MEDYSTSWNVNLQVTIPLFSGLSSFHERKQLASREAQLEILQSQSIDSASLNQITAEKNLIASSDVIVSSKLASEYARESLVEAEKEYRLSISDLISYLTVETSFLSAETAFDQAKFGFIDSISKFYIASGLPLLEFVQWLDAQGKKPI